MSVVFATPTLSLSPILPPPSSSSNPTRKRTSSFCSSQIPSKAPRTDKMGMLRRSESFVSLPELESKASTSTSFTAVPYKRSLRCYKDQKEKRKALLQRAATCQPLSPPPPLPSTTTTAADASDASTQLTMHTQKSIPKQYPASSSACRVTSPLSPVRAVLPARPSFPRSKQEPDLYRQAITTRMRCTPEGQKILHMGPRLALSIMSATKELERIVAAQAQVQVQAQGDKERERDGDVVMGDSGDGVMNTMNTPPALALSSSWVIVDDWEMIDCGA